MADEIEEIKFHIIKNSDKSNGIANGIEKADFSTFRGDIIVCCGGYEGRFELDTVEAFCVNTNTWVDLPPMPVECDSLTAGAYGSAVFVAGGSDRKKPLNNVSMFDWQERAWRKLAPMVTARSYSCGTMDKSRACLLVAGGFNNRELDSMEIFDVKTERWLKAPAMPTARTKSGGAIVGDYFAVVGGDEFGRPTDTIQCFNLKTEKWETFPAMSTKRRRCAVVAVGEKLVVAGGLTLGDYSLDTIEMFDLRNRKWFDLPNMPCTRFGCGACVINSQMFLCGGNEKLRMKAYSNRLDSFDLMTHTWEILPNMAHRRIHPVAVSVSV
ncbi:kelch-like protein diablo [Pocillopora verrucosa]|uniref:kelch-like protein diablo n=1 Tax=Pocillopora verrucosa TaxID=203993 RepID=UPI0033406243